MLWENVYNAKLNGKKQSTGHETTYSLRPLNMHFYDIRSKKKIKEVNIPGSKVAISGQYN